MKNISILGSTGSIGTQTLDIVRANDDLNVVAIAAGSNITKLEEQIREFHPELVCVFNEDAALKLKDAVKDTSVKLVAGMDGLIEAAVYEKAELWKQLRQVRILLWLTRRLWLQQGILLCQWLRNMA